MTYINYLYAYSPIVFIYAGCTFINFLYASVFLVLYKKKFIYATILTNLTNTLLGFCVYKIFLTYTSFQVIFYIQAQRSFHNISLCIFLIFSKSFMKKLYIFQLSSLSIQSKIVHLQYEIKQYEFKLYAYVTRKPHTKK